MLFVLKLIKRCSRTIRAAFLTAANAVLNLIMLPTLLAGVKKKACNSGLCVTLGVLLGASPATCVSKSLEKVLKVFVESTLRSPIPRLNSELF